MIEKINGRFLRIEETGNSHKVHYVRKDGSPNGVSVDNDGMVRWAKRSQIKVEELGKRLRENSDEKEIDKLEHLLEIYQIFVLWPRMWIAYCEDNTEVLRGFFELSGNQPSDEKADLPIVKRIMLEECRKECQKRELPIGKTLSREQKYSIA